MKTNIILLCVLFLCLTARAQYQFIDLSTLTTNPVSSAGSYITIPGICTLQPYSITNPTFVTVGDTIPTAFSKVNGDLLYISNQLVQALILPSQINTNLYIYGAALSNYVTTLAGNITWSNEYVLAVCVTNTGSGYTLTNGIFSGIFYGNGRFLAIDGTNLDAGSVNSNSFDSGTMYWLQHAFIYSGGAMNFDGGDIYSSGAGDLYVNGDGNGTFSGTLYASTLQGTTLDDSGNNSGGSGQVAESDGSGYWYWTALPTTMSFDGGLIYSDGSGDIISHAFQGQLWDSGYSSGSSGYVPTANGDGTWDWSQTSVIPDSAGNGGTCVHVKAQDNGSDMYIHVTSAGVITATSSP